MDHLKEMQYWHYLQRMDQPLVRENTSYCPTFTLPVFDVSAPADYSAINTSLIFQHELNPNLTVCAKISIILDEIVESIESFQILLGSFDSGIVIAEQKALAHIEDNSCELFTITKYTILVKIIICSCSC